MKWSNRGVTTFCHGLSHEKYPLHFINMCNRNFVSLDDDDDIEEYWRLYLDTFTPDGRRQQETKKESTTFSDVLCIAIFLFILIHSASTGFLTHLLSNMLSPGEEGLHQQPSNEGLALRKPLTGGLALHKPLTGGLALQPLKGGLGLQQQR